MNHFPSLVLIAMCMAVFVSCSENNYDTKYRTSNLTQEVPSYFRRLYEEWSVNSACNDEMVKSSQAEIRRRSSNRFAIKTRIPKYDSAKLIKSEIRVEFDDIPRPRRMANRNYSALITPMDSAIDPDFQLMQDIAVNKSVVDMSINITAILVKSLALGKKFVHVRLAIQRESKPAKGLHGANFKAFLIVHVVDDTCRKNTVNATRSFVRTLSFLPISNKLSPRALTRSNGKQSTFGDPCRLKEWEVFTEDTDFGEVIVHPSVIKANSCNGKCQFPLHGVNTTEHAFLKAYVYQSTRGAGSQLPCCVPQSLGPSPLILYDRMEDSYFITDKPNIIAKSCACL